MKEDIDSNGGEFLVTGGHSSTCHMFSLSHGRILEVHFLLDVGTKVSGYHIQFYSAILSSGQSATEIHMH